MRHSTKHLRKYLPARILAILMLSCAFVATGVAQAESQSPFGTGRNNRDDQPKSVKEYLAKQRLEKSKKDHEELLRRGDELLSLTGQLEAAYERNNDLTAVDRAKLESVEKLAERIRRSLGGDGDDEDDPAEGSAEDKKSPATTKDAVVDLKEVVVRLVDELKKTSRFTISAVAIQSSNSVLKLVRFLRLRK